MTDIDDQQLDERIRAARPVAPPDFEARVLGAARLGRGRAWASAAAVVVLAAAAVVVVVVRRPPAEGEHAPPIARPAGPWMGSGSAAPPLPPPPPSWADPRALVAALVAPRLAELRACHLHPEVRLRAYQALDTAPDAPRPTRLSVIGHRTLTADEACLERVLAELSVPALPAQVLAIDLAVALPDGAAPPLVRDEPWRDPVGLVERAVAPAAPSACYDREIRKLRTPSFRVAGPHGLALGVSVGRDPSGGATRAHHLRDWENAREARCLDQRLAALELPPLPPGIIGVELAVRVTAATPR